MRSIGARMPRFRRILLKQHERVEISTMQFYLLRRFRELACLLRRERAFRLLALPPLRAMFSLPASAVFDQESPKVLKMVYLAR